MGNRFDKAQSNSVFALFLKHNSAGLPHQESGLVFMASLWQDLNIRLLAS